MTFLVRIARFLFWLLVVSWSVALLRRLVGWMVGKAAEQNQNAGYEAPGREAIARRLVKDPVCGMHIPEARGIPLREGEETVYFCSMECRERYLDGTKKLAANA